MALERSTVSATEVRPDHCTDTGAQGHGLRVRPVRPPRARHGYRASPRRKHGELDLALIYDHDALTRKPDDDLDRLHLLDDPFHAVLPAQHKLARHRRVIKLEQLAGETWVGGGPTSSWFQIVPQSCHQAVFEPAVAFTTDD